jgi:hypothetical protein
MVSDVFGDLTETREVLEVIEHLRASRSLDEHQYGLARVLRYKVEPQLQEAALDCACLIGAASDVLIADTLDMLVSTEVPLMLRVKACRALGHLVPRYQTTMSSEYDVSRVYQTMRDLAALPQPPILGGALLLTLDQLALQMRRAISARPTAADIPSAP